MSLLRNLAFLAVLVAVASFVPKETADKVFTWFLAVVVCGGGGLFALAMLLEPLLGCFSRRAA